MPGMLRKSTAFVPRYQWFESISLQQRVCKLSVPERLKPRSPKSGAGYRRSIFSTARRVYRSTRKRQAADKSGDLFRDVPVRPIRQKECRGEGDGRRQKDIERDHVA